LPALTGEVLGSVDETERFLADFRRTLTELQADAHQRSLAEGAHARGLQVYAEALEDHRPQLGDDLAMRRYADVPMGAMWTLPPGGAPRATFVADLQGAASVAHVWGQRLVGAESFSAFGFPWAFSPRDLKPTADAMLALGVNRFFIHSSAHQPSSVKPPGLALSTLLGQYFNRNDTWAPMAGAWVSYLARSAFLMQQGQRVTDIAYFVGEDAPVTALFGEQPVADLPPGHAFDFIGPDALSKALRVERGQLVSVGGGRWRVLYLGGSSQRMSVAALRRVLALLRAGARVVGPAPDSSPSLSDSASAFSRLREQIWGGCTAGGAAVKVGAGRLWCHKDLAGALRAEQVETDGVLEGAEGAEGGQLQVVHRALKHGGAIYFVHNPETRPVQGWLQLRHSGFEPEWWHAEDGLREPASFRRTATHLEIDTRLPAQGSAFIVLQKRSTAIQRQVETPRLQPVREIAGPWQLQFQAGRGAPDEITLPSLLPWNEHTDPGVRYFSGIASYRTEFTAPALSGAGWLELGEVAEVAEVTLNGTPLGTAWLQPYRLPTGAALKAGRNVLEVKVANLWVNRLIGDAQPGAERIAFTSVPTYRPDAPLRRSGLLGPVRLLESARP
jgi:hypothetical protein